MSIYKLSKPAEEDIAEIFEYSYVEFGIKQAETYTLELKFFLQKLSENPRIGRQRTEIKLGLYSFPQLEHTIFYRIFKTHIRIVRVLHSSRDLKNFL